YGLRKTNEDGRNPRLKADRRRRRSRRSSYPPQELQGSSPTQKLVRLIARVQGGLAVEIAVFVRHDRVNSRPLTPLSSEPGDLESLTPGHFLTGQNLLCVPEPDVLNAPSHLVSRWKLLHQCHQVFWKRWSSEYLNNLQIPSKWTSNDTPLKVGDLVCIKDNLSTPLCWRLGRITELLPGQDKVVRVVKLLAGQGTLVRPVSRGHHCTAHLFVPFVITRCCV
ncbi:Uncharacterized protein FWK35_00018832, partial [Aphis craccivora]